LIKICFGVRTMVYARLYPNEGMEDNMLKKIKIFSFLLIAMAISLSAADDFDLQFVVITNDQVHFDVKIQIKRNNSDWDKLGDANLSFSHSTAALDNASLLTAHNFSGGFYEAMTVTNPANASVNIELLIDDNGTAVSTSWMDVATVRFDVLNPALSSNLQWLGSDVTFTVFDDDNATQLDPGTLSNMDVSLPVQMSGMQAESTVQGIEVSWITHSEVNSQGFYVWRSQEANGTYEKITTNLIASQGNNSEGSEYLFTDKNTESEAIYYYKIQQLDQNGSSEFFGPIQVKALFIPEEYSLSNNYPNPFNPSTTFTYDIPEVSDVQIHIYNLLGKEERILVHKQQVPGRYTETWNGTDEKGQKLPSGVYFMRMQAGTYTSMKKLTLMR
jgi:hypothetical protein